MKYLPAIVSFAAGLALAASAAHAGPLMSDFNGSGFEFTVGDFNNNTRVGAEAIEIGLLAFSGQYGFGGFSYGTRQDFSDRQIGLTLQLGDDNEADNFQVRLQDDAGNSAVFEYKAADFSSSAFTTVVLDGPSFTLGAVDLTAIRLWVFSGDFSGDRNARLHVFVDHIEASTADVDPPDPVPAPGTLLLAGAGLVALRGSLRRRAATAGTPARPA